VSTDSETPAYSSVESWARGRLAAPGLAEPLRRALGGLVEVLAAEREAEHEVFLSIVIRTQARRWEQLQDALLCLAAQTDRAFELLLMLHGVEPELRERVRELVREYPAEFADRVRVIDVSGGTRTRPLAVSVEHARGAYIAFYDDDDLVMANWVEAFHSGARSAPGQVIRANVATQLNRPEAWLNGVDGQRSIGVAKAEYARRFNLIDHLERNHTPFMGLAFPREFFTLWGEGFDETLPVCEDWDILLRAATLLGVRSVPELTAIYRQWESATTSYTAHARDEWEEAEARVAQKIDALPFLAPAGTVSDTLESRAEFRDIERDLWERHTEMATSTSWRLTAPLRKTVERVRRMRGSR
jgi:hypothetical protein